MVDGDPPQHTISHPLIRDHGSIQLNLNLYNQQQRKEQFKKKNINIIISIMGAMNNQFYELKKISNH